MYMKTEKKLLWGFGLALAILCMATVVSYFSITDLVENANWVAHTQEVIVKTERVLTDMQDMETGTRGYFIAGEDRFLEPYLNGSKRYFADLRQVKALTRDNPNQQRRLEELVTKCRNKADLCDQIITQRRNEGFESTSKNLVMGQGAAMMDEIRTIIAEMVSEEESLLKVRHTVATEQAHKARMLLPFLILADFILLSICYYYVSSIVLLKEKNDELTRSTDGSTQPL